MAELTAVDKIKLENIFVMESGYVLDFSNNSFQSFVLSVTSKDIYDEKYSFNGNSKANRLRSFWEIESNFLVAKLTFEMLEYWKTIKHKYSDFQKRSHMYENCIKVAERLKQNDQVSDSIEAISDIESSDKDFNILFELIRDLIEKNKPEAALDRLHTYTVKFVRQLCKKHGISYDNKPLHSIYGEYAKYLRNNNLIESQMTDTILKTAISIMDKFNKVRNDESFAHDNPILNYEESLLIFKNVTSIIEFINAIENDYDKQEKAIDSFDNSW